MGSMPPVDGVIGSPGIEIGVDSGVGSGEACGPAGAATPEAPGVVAVGPASGVGAACGTWVGDDGAAC
jgi:hypothetical protein